MHIHIPLSLSLWYFPFLHPFLFTSMMANHQSAHTPSNRLYSQIYLRAFGQLIKLVGNELHLVPERNYWPRLNVTGEIIISQKGLTSGNIANRISSSVRNYGRDNIGNIKPRLVATGGARPFLLFFSFFLFFFFFFYREENNGITHYALRFPFFTFSFFPFRSPIPTCTPPSDVPLPESSN